MKCKLRIKRSIYMESYQYIRQIKRGTYSEVWLVKCSKTKKKYVLKQLDLHYAGKRVQRGAYQEVRQLSILKHPNLISYLDAFHNSNGSLFIVMAYCECGDLHSLIRSRNGVHFEEKEVINMFVQICMGIKYLHDKGILHRDLRTKNIYLTRTKLIKVGDLGMAHVLKNTEEMNSTLSSPPYLTAPEYTSVKSYTQKSDIWALGCCTYEICSLEPLSNAQDESITIQNVIHQKLSSISQFYSVELISLICSMLVLDPEERVTATDLLLGDFIRQYILQFLRTSPPKNKISKRNNCKTVSTPRTCNQVIHLYDEPAFFCRRNLKNLISSPLNTSILDSHNDSNGHIELSLASEGNVETLRTPELNLNTYFGENNLKHSSTNLCRKNFSPSSTNTKCFKENAHSKDIQSLSSKQLNDLNIITQKLRSKISFQLLSNLAIMMNHSRIPYSDTQTFRSQSEVRYFWTNGVPRSAEELYSHSRSAMPARNAQSAKQITVSEEGSTKSSVQLPTIGDAKSSKPVTKSSINLPAIQNNSSKSGDQVSVSEVTSEEKYPEITEEKTAQDNSNTRENTNTASTLKSSKSKSDELKKLVYE